MYKVRRLMTLSKEVPADAAYDSFGIAESHHAGKHSYGCKNANIEIGVTGEIQKIGTKSNIRALILKDLT